MLHTSRVRKNEETSENAFIVTLKVYNFRWNRITSTGVLRIVISSHKIGKVSPLCRLILQFRRCNLDEFYDRYSFIRYSSDPSLTLMEDLFQVFREQKVSNKLPNMFL